MPPPTQERIGVVGLGAIGGSLALAWRESGAVRAWSRDPSDRHQARSAGIPLCAGGESDWVNDMASSTAVVVAVPVDEIANVVRRLLPLVPDECLLLHVGSLQRRDALGLREPEFQRVLGTHPLAGSERAGFSAASPEMFRRATVRAEARATEPMRERIQALWRMAGVGRIIWQDAVEHDALMSWVSHLSQLTSTAIAGVLAERGISPHDLGPGARGATRLAGSDFSIWSPILARAPDDTATALRRLSSVLHDLASALEARDSRALERTWQRARSWTMRGEEPA